MASLLLLTALILSAAKCANDQYRCWDGACIPGDQHCDRVKHCSDDSDEVECGELITSIDTGSDESKDSKSGEGRFFESCFIKFDDFHCLCQRSNTLLLPSCFNQCFRVHINDMLCRR